MILEINLCMHRIAGKMPKFCDLQTDYDEIDKFLTCSMISES